MSIDRRVLAGGGVLVAAAAVLHACARLLPSGAGTLLVDLGIPLLETTVLVLAVVAFLKNRASRYRWTWALLGLWAAANLFGDAAWGWYELVLGKEPPTGSAADVGYLASYPLAFATVVFASWKAAGRLRALEGGLDAMMITIGAAGIAWPTLLAPLLASSSTGLQQVINLAYPLGDLLVIVAFASLMLGSIPRQPPRFLIILWAAFLVQVVADSLYFIQTADGAPYQSGNVPDSLWALAFALAGIGALVGVLSPEKPSVRAMEAGVAPSATAPPSRALAVASLSYSTPTYARMLLPYLALPLMGMMLWMQVALYGTRWDTESAPLIYLGIALVVLLVIRQFVTLVHNRLLNTGLSELSRELNDWVQELGDLTGRLGELDSRSAHLNSLQGLDEAMKVGLELAGSVTHSSAAWICLRQEDGTEPVAAIWGTPGDVPEVGSCSAPQQPSGAGLRHVALEARGEKIGSLWLARPLAREDEPDLAHTVAAQLATAIDNTRRYEEALRLAERDPLTGLLNHRGIHERLAGEGRRAQEHHERLSVVMIDLDDFKLLNDSYGHPTGDRVLRQVGEAIRAALRQSDLAGRVGGDELMLVLPDTDRDGALRLAERTREAVAARPFVNEDGRAIPIKLSFGVATYPTDADCLSQLVSEADESLYASKQRGGDTITPAGTEPLMRGETRGLRGVAGRLLDVVGSRDHYTRRHSDHVVLHAVALGEAMGLPEESLETLRLSAMLHDVGKLGVRAAVLQKPGPLTFDEERAVREHVDIGQTIIRDLPRVAEVLEVVKAHHERHDGEGYPTGLSGEDIPLLARILSVADTYSAMVVDQPYRRKLTREQAKAELVRAAGSQLDPDLVKAFLVTLGDKPSRSLAIAG